MTHAILLISSYGIDYLNHFIEQFKDCSNYDIYIHIDNKTYQEYQTISNPNIKFIGHLYDSPRYSKNMVLVMFKLLQLSQKNNYDYYHFFSDHCYFIQTPTVFFDKLNNAQNKSFLTYYLSNNFYNDKQLYKSTQWISLHQNIVNQLINYEDLINQYLIAYDDKNLIINDGALDEIVIQNIIFDKILNYDFTLIENNSLRYIYFEFTDSAKILTINEIHKHDLTYIYNNFYILRKIDYNNINSINFLESVKQYNNQKQYSCFKYNEYCNIWCAYHSNTFLEQYNLINTNNLTLFNTNKTDLEEININYLSSNLSEFVMYYYIWKNQLKSKYIGICHYRRHFNYIDFDNINNQSIQIFKSIDLINENYLDRLLNTGFNTYIVYSFINYLQTTKNINIDNYIINNTKIAQYSTFICTWDVFNDICETIFGFLDKLIPNWKVPNKLCEFTDDMFTLYKYIAKKNNFTDIWNCIAIRYIAWWQQDKPEIIQYRFSSIMLELLLGIYINIQYNTFITNYQYNLIIELKDIKNIDKVYNFYKKNIKSGFKNIYLIYNDDDLWIDSYQYQQLLVIKSINDINNTFPNIWITNLFD